MSDCLATAVAFKWSRAMEGSQAQPLDCGSVRESDLFKQLNYVQGST